MTSNVGTRQLKDFGRGVGFNAAGDNESKIDSEFSRGVIQKALNRTFAPEFLNRVDDVVMKFFRCLLQRYRNNNGSQTLFV